MKAQARALYRSLLAVVFFALGAAVRARYLLAPHYQPGRVHRILVLRFGLLGDGTALLSPALQVLRERFPDATVDVLATPLQASLLTTQPWVDGVVLWEAGDLTEPRRALRPSAWRAAWRAVQALRGRRYDLAISLYGQLGSAVALLSGARHRFGYASEAFPGTLTHTLPGGRYEHPWHEVLYDVALARAAAGVPNYQLADESPAPQLSVTAEARAAAARLLGPDRRHFATLHLGAKNGPAKRWPVERWAELLPRLHADGLNVVLVGGAEDEPIAAELLRRVSVPVTSLVGHTSIPELLAVLERAAVMVSGDSGPMHLAVALGRPTVAIYGPTDPRIYGPVGGASTVVVRREIACSPCYRLDRVAECPLGHTLCQWLVTPETVNAAVRRALASAGNEGAATPSGSSVRDDA